MLKCRIDQPEAFLTLPFRILPVHVLETAVTQHLQSNIH